MTALGAAIVLAMLHGSERVTSPPPVTPIVGGDLADDPLFDSVVALSLPLARSCSGVLVSPSLIMTAAHCVAEVAASEHIGVSYGDNGFGGSLQAVSWGHHAQRYCPDCKEDRFDVGWIEIAESLTLDEGFPRPVSVQAEWDDVMQEGTLVSVAGFGATVGGGGSDGIKRAVSIEVTDISKGGLEFFAGGDGRDSCDGDSGGPALTRLANGQIRLAGLVSRGPVACGTGGVYSTPYPSLCAMRDATGVDLTIPGCEQCDCLDVRPDEEGGCRVGAGSRTNLVWAPLFVIAVARRRRH